MDVQMYLKKINRIPLISETEEADLVKKIEAGNVAAEKLELADEKGRELERAELHRLRCVKQAGDDAKRQLIEANLRLVVKIARRYEDRGIPFDDLIQEGNLGLMKAVEEVECKKESRFSTYAARQVRQAIINVIPNKPRAESAPVYKVANENRFTRIRDELAQLYGREPSTEELALAMGVDVDRI